MKTNKWRKKIRYFVYFLIWLNGTRMTRVWVCHFIQSAAKRFPSVSCRRATLLWFCRIKLHRWMGFRAELWHTCVCVAIPFCGACWLWLRCAIDSKPQLKTHINNITTSTHGPGHHRIKTLVRRDANCEVSRKLLFPNRLMHFHCSLFAHKNGSKREGKNIYMLFSSSPIHTATDCWKLTYIIWFMAFGVYWFSDLIKFVSHIVILFPFTSLATAFRAGKRRMVKTAQHRLCRIVAHNFDAPFLRSGKNGFVFSAGAGYVAALLPIPQL